MIIFTDVDGTIYDYNGIIPERTKYAIKKLRENGHYVIMVTGRSKAENKQELLDIGFDGMIGGNGSYIEVNDEVLLHQTISYEQCRKIVDWCHDNNIEFYEESNDGLFASENFCERVKDAIIKYSIGKGMPDDKARKLEVKDVFHGLVENADLYRRDLNKISFVLNSYDDYLNAEKLFPEMKVGTWGGKHEQALFGDFGIKDIDKAKAIQIVLDYLNIAQNQSIAIGDGKIDIPMLKYCNTGITFRSVSQEVKDAAKYITDDVDDEGFYKAFRHLKLI